MLKPAVLIVSAVLAAPLAHAATLAEALHRWTGVTPDVTGQGDRVRVDLPPGSPVPWFTAQAHPGMRAGEPGWELTDIALAQPWTVQGHDTLRLRGQHGRAWLGARTVQADVAAAGVAVGHRDDVTDIDGASARLDSSGGPVTVSVDVGAVHAERPGAGGALLPRHATLRGHTTPEGAAALSAMFGGARTGPATVTVDALVMDIGAAEFSGAGSVTFASPTDRTGQILVSVRHFDELLRQMPLDPAGARAYPALMVLRQMGQKQQGRLTWTITFAGAQVLVNGVDLAPLLGW